MSKAELVRRYIFFIVGLLDVYKRQDQWSWN